MDIWAFVGPTLLVVVGYFLNQTLTGIKKELHDLKREVIQLQIDQARMSQQLERMG